MANAFADILGFAGKAADGLLTGGQIGGSRRANRFADLLDAGQYDQAAQYATRQGEGGYAQLAQQRGLAAQKAQADQQAQENEIFSGLSIALSQIADPQQRMMAFEAMKPGLAQRFGLDDEDFAQVPLQDQNALRLFGQQFIAPEAQVNQRLKGEAQAEDMRSNRVGEGLRSREIGIAQQNADTAEYKARAPRTGGMITLPDGTVIQTGPTPQDSALRRVESRGQRISLISDKFDEAIKQVGRGSAGLAGTTAQIPGTPAKDLKETLATIQANIGFEELNAMREASPTGGALGQVTEREIAFLQAVLGSLDQTQSPEQLKNNLERAKREVVGSWERVMAAYEQDFGQEYSGPGSSISAGEPNAPDLPEGVTEEDISYTMQKHGLSREEVLRRLNP